MTQARAKKIQQILQNLTGENIPLGYRSGKKVGSTTVIRVANGTSSVLTPKKNENWKNMVVIAGNRSSVTLSGKRMDNNTKIIIITGNRVQLAVNMAFLERRNQQSNVTIISVGDESETKVAACADIRNNEKKSIAMKHIFIGKKNLCAMNIAVVADGKATGDVSGKMEMQKTATETDATLIEKVLILDGSPDIEAKPEIHADIDNIRASHGASIAKLGEEEKFFMASRGLKKEEIQKIIRKAHLSAPFYELQADSSFLK